MIRHGTHAGRPGQGLIAGAVEIGFAAKTFPARHRHQRLKARSVGSGDDIAAIRPIHLEMAGRCGCGAAVADIGAENAELQPVVAVKRVQGAAVGAHLIGRPSSDEFRVFARFHGLQRTVTFFNLGAGAGSAGNRVSSQLD